MQRKEGGNFAYTVNAIAFPCRFDSAESKIKIENQARGSAYRGGNMHKGSCVHSLSPQVQSRMFSAPMAVHDRRTD